MGAVLKPFDRMRRTRNRSEYPSFTTPEVTADNVQADLGIASSIELNQQVAEVYAAVDGVYQAADQGQSTSQYQHARQELQRLNRRGSPPCRPVALPSLPGGPVVVEGL
jgi:hypothetical protein